MVVIVERLMCDRFGCPVKTKKFLVHGGYSEIKGQITCNGKKHVFNNQRIHWATIDLSGMNVLSLATVKYTYVHTHTQSKHHSTALSKIYFSYFHQSTSYILSINKYIFNTIYGNLASSDLYPNFTSSNWEYLFEMWTTKLTKVDTIIINCKTAVEFKSDAKIRFTRSRLPLYMVFHSTSSDNYYIWERGT